MYVQLVAWIGLNKPNRLPVEDRNRMNKIIAEYF
jgi:hypothetical protein